MSFFFTLISSTLTITSGLITVTIDPSKQADGEIPSNLNSVGIEYLNHEVYGYGLYAQMIFGESFEEPGGTIYENPRNPQPLPERDFVGCGNYNIDLLYQPNQFGQTNDPNLVESISKMWMAYYTPNNISTDFLPKYDIYTLINSKYNAFNGNQFQRIHFDENLGNNTIKQIGIVNHGLNCQWGMYYKAGHKYSGEIHLKNKGTVNIVLMNDDTVVSNIITIKVNSNEWKQYSLEFEINKLSSVCSFNATTAYYSCNGKFVIYLTNPGDIIDIDYVYLQPNGTDVVDDNIPARSDIAQLLKDEGIGYIRFGGSMVNNQHYRWKTFRGPRNTREPYPGFWYEQQGLSQTRGFGMFEVIDLCNNYQVNCEPIITMNINEMDTDMADFVEYCWGNSSTKWGKQRYLDGHPNIYNVSFIELGNEEPMSYNILVNMIRITTLMDIKSQEINAPLFRYTIGHNLQTGEIESNSLVVDYITELSSLGDRIFWDFHLYNDANSVDGAQDLVEAFQSLTQKLNSKMRWMCLEENGNDHGMARGIGHAFFNNLYVKFPGFGIVHGYANGIQAFQGMNYENDFPQGQIFHMPNMSWGQPTYYVNQMLNNYWQPKYIESSTSTDPYTNFNATAAASIFKKRETIQVSVYLVNWGSDQIAVQLKMNNDIKDYTDNGMTLITLAGNGQNSEENTPDNPTKISPKKQNVQSINTLITMTPLSFTIASFETEIRD